jgi:ankyrin repeat protein
MQNLIFFSLELKRKLTTEDQWTALHFASQEGYMKAVRRLLQFGADPNAQLENGYEILSFSIRVLPSLLQFLSLIAIIFLNSIFSNRQTPLHLASQHGHVSVISTLIRHGASVHARSVDGATCLHQAACFDHGSCLKLLLQNGCSVDETAFDGNNPLHIACLAGSLSCVKILIQSGANCNAYNEDGMIPQQLAFEQGHHDCARCFSPLELMDDLDQSLPSYSDNN